MKMNFSEAMEPTTQQLEQIEKLMGQEEELMLEPEQEFEEFSASLAQEDDENEEMPKKDEEKKTASDEDAFYLDGFKMYLKQIGSIPRLSREEELELGKKIAENGPDAKEAKKKLISANLRLVVHYAKSYQGRGVDMEDLSQLGYFGLDRAAGQFDYTKGFRFSTYATWWIRQSISRGIADEGSTVRIPVHMGEQISKVKKAQEQVRLETGTEATVAQLVQRTNIPEEKVKAALEAMYTMVSMDMSVGEDKDTTLGEFLPDEKVESPENNVVQMDLAKKLNEVLDRLDPKEAKVLRLRYGIGVKRPYTLEEIAKLPEFDVTRERIRQIEGKALRKIQKSASMREQLKDFAS